MAIAAGSVVDGISVVGDEDLAEAVKAAASGDETGFATVWRALQPAVLRYLRVVVGDAAEDVASETWLQAARDLHRFTGGPMAFRGWLFGIARHRALDQRRHATRHREEPAGWSHDTARAPAPDAGTEAVERSGTAWALRVIATLPPDQAEAVTLRVVVGLDVATTAQVLGKRPGSIRVATMRGLRRLAAHPDVVALEERMRWRPGAPWPDEEV
jgi:RNA polymerase sigma-70 factor (ECF subfamily)